MKTNLFCFAVALAACGGGVAAVNISQSVGAAGGAVAASDGSSVAIPASALASDTMVSIHSTPNAAAPTSATVVGTLYTFGPEGQTFTTPVTITLAVALDKLPAGKTISNVIIFTAPAGSTNYTTLTTRVVDATHVAADTTHFSGFVPAVAGACTVTCTTSGQSCSNEMGGGGCTPSTGCSCTATCLPDGSQGATCSDSSTGGGDTCAGSGTTYLVFCGDNGNCTCSAAGVSKGAATTTATCSATPAHGFDAYTACGFPGAYAAAAASGSSGSSGSSSGGNSNSH